MMGALRLLGIPIAGQKFPRFDDENANEPLGDQQARVRKHMERMNPAGFWEVPGAVVRGLAAVGDHGGRAIKIISHGLVPGIDGRGPTGTDPELVWRYVLCLRDPRHVAESQRDLRNPVDVADGGAWAYQRGPADPRRYLAGNGRLALWLESRPLDDWISIDYDELVARPLAGLQRIARHLDHQPTTDQLAAAAASYDLALRRSPATAADWPPPLALDGQAADLVYQALGSLNRADLGVAALAVRERQEAHQLETNQWYDPAVGWMINAAVERRIRRDRTFRDQLRRAAWRGILTGHHPQVCEPYDEIRDAPTYTIRRPADLGDWSATMCRWRGQVVTREHAFRLHQADCANPATVNPPVDHAKVRAWRWEWPS